MTQASAASAEPQRHEDTELILRRRAARAAPPGQAPEPAGVAPAGAVGVVAPSAAIEALPPGAARVVPPKAPAFVAPPEPPAAAPAPSPQAPPAMTWGLALSGGGIRSATFSLGVLQAIAAAPSTIPPAPAAATPGGLYRSSLLSHFDYLSTVSGGGYVGAFLCSLFLPGRLRPPATPSASDAPAAREEAAARAADDAVRVLRDEPPGRRSGDGSYDDAHLHQAPLAWLRDNGRYLAPSGGGDMLYAASLALRNWIAVHYVLGTLLLGLFSVLAELVVRVRPLRELDADNLGIALAGTTWAEQLWWSPIFMLAALVFVLWVAPAGLAFWIPTPEGIEGRCAVVNRAFLGYVAIVVVFGAVWASGLVPIDDARFEIWAGGALAVCIGLALFLANRVFTDAVETLRVRLTRQLAAGLALMGGLLALGLVDTAAHSIYLQLVGEDARPAHTLAPASLVMALVWVVQRIAKAADDMKPPEWIARLPWTVIGGAAGIAIFALTAVGWALAVVWLEWLGAPPGVAAVRAGDHAGLLCWLALAMLALAALTGQFPSFINLSSLQSFYGSRLTRAYLGASNGARFVPQSNRRKASVAEPELQDAVRVADYLVPGDKPALATHAPLHLVNVTMNNTVDPGEQLVQRDRKGEPLLVTPLGFTVSGEFHQFPVLQPRFEIQRTLSVGQWIGTSGAAFSTGIGRQTSLGLSLLLGAANVRLGTWWESGAGSDPPRAWPVQLLRDAFRTQCYLIDEFTAKFHGLRRQWQYLSDGGHFENTGLYELLRPSRRVEFVIACDNGADPGYAFADLANLIRLVRIDLGLELEVDASVREHPVLRHWIGVPEDFRAARAEPAAPKAAAEGEAEPPEPACEPVALLLRARPGGTLRPTCWILLLKPRVRADSAADVLQYRIEHPDFPQEPTSAQFFDEAQWESYRKLGRDNAAALLDESVWLALHAHIAEESLQLMVA